jgi:cytochrome c
MRGVPDARSWLGNTHRRHGWMLRCLFVVLAGALLAGCGTGGSGRDRLAVEVAGGEPGQGPGLMRAYGCNDCHTIPGVRGANTMVGPPLTHWSRRAYIAGLVPNTPENLVRWIHNPHLIHPQSAMPNMNVHVEHARHMAAYLYTIR